jgi:two-component system, NarL family, nitrate/nitrite response regulator NarL
MAAEHVRIALVDDRPLFRRGLELLLPAVTADRVEVAGSTGDAAAAAGLVRRCRPDLVLVDLALPRPGGVRAIAAIRRTEPAVPVVAMGRAEAEPELAVEALRAGAVGLVPTASEPEDLVAPLLAVMDGAAVLPTCVLERLLSRGGSPAAGALGRLDPRERELWRLVAAGASTTDIALRLHVSERTVKRLVAALLRQLRVSSRTEAAALAGRAGLLDRPA